MSNQVWIAKLAQNLQPGELIPGQGKYPLALEIKSVETQENVVIVYCYKDVYRLLPLHEFHMTVNQHVPVAKSGVEHMDEITTFEISDQD